MFAPSALSRIPHGTIKIGGGVYIGAAARGYNFANELIERLVRGQALANPAILAVGVFMSESFAIHAEQICPLERPVLRELGSPQ